MSMLSDRVGAVLTAPIPFLIALVPIGFATWGAMECGPIVRCSIKGKSCTSFHGRRSLTGMFDHCTRFFDSGSCLWRSRAFQMPKGAN